MQRETFSINWLAVNLQVDRRTLNKRLEGVARHGEAREYYLADVFRALAVTPPKVSELERTRARLAVAQAQRVEQEVALNEGQLMQADVVLAWIDDMAAVVKQRLMVIPDHLVAKLEPAAGSVAAPLVRELIREAVNELSDRSPRLSEPRRRRALGSNGSQGRRS